MSLLISMSFDEVMICYFLPPPPKAMDGEEESEEGQRVI